MSQNAFHLKIFADLSGRKGKEEGEIGENGEEKRGKL